MAPAKRVFDLNTVEGDPGRLLSGSILGYDKRMAVNPGENNSLRHWRRVIEQDPARLGGAPVFRGTRVPVKSLFDHLSAGDSVEIFLTDFPGVTRKQIKAVLALAAQHLLARRR